MIVTNNNYRSLDRSQIVRVQKSPDFELFIAKAAVRSPIFAPSAKAGGQTVITAGAAAYDESLACLKCYAEIVERTSAICAAFETHEFIKASIKELSSNGQAFVDVGRLGLLFDSAVTWIEGSTFASGSKIWVPALLSFLSWKPRPVNNENRETIFCKPNSTGLAAHTDRDLAERSAIFEVLERDAIIRSWETGENICEISAFDYSRSIEAYLKIYPDSLKFYQVNGESGFHVVVCLNSGDLSRAGFVVGSSGESSLLQAIEKAFLETLMIQSSFGPADKILARIYSAQARSRERVLSSLEKLLYFYADGQQVKDFYADHAQNFRRKVENSDFRQTCKKYEFAIVDVTDSAAVASGWHVVRAVSAHARSPVDNLIMNTNGTGRVNPFG